MYGPLRNPIRIYLAICVWLNRLLVFYPESMEGENMAMECGHIQPMTALEFRRRMARAPNMTEEELRSSFSSMAEDEVLKFLQMYDNPDIRDVDTFIGWLKVLKAL